MISCFLNLIYLPLIHALFEKKRITNNSDSIDNNVNEQEARRQAATAPGFRGSSNGDDQHHHHHNDDNNSSHSRSEASGQLQFPQWKGSVAAMVEQDKVKQQVRYSFMYLFIHSPRPIQLSS